MGILVRDELGYYFFFFRPVNPQSLIYVKKIKPTNLDNREVGSFFLDLDTKKNITQLIE